MIDRELIVARSVIPERRERVPGAPVNHEHQGTRIEAHAAQPGNCQMISRQRRGNISLGSEEETSPHVRDTLQTHSQSYA